MTPCVCDICQKEGIHGFRGYVIEGKVKYYCPDHVSQAPIKRGSYIVDATGKFRDRVWLNNKLEMTRTEKNWHRDIKSRRIAKDGTVYRKNKI